ncbi:uncharacterized protein B0T23DRAFT_241480 [Neurospora hispaniola]|uniref:Uncharacterized protein n=1 Tax=Neurospora hispaniola TaxID=588809 RepID=A0AAJ0HZH1_9PEZI|nr:hypothetical protein B0T23DRAFT_241480 [Neurospora hispaniola]
MHGSKHTAALFALAYGHVVLGLEDVAPVAPAAATVPNPQSLYIQFMHPTPRSYGYGQDLGFRLDVNPSVTNLPIGSDDSCASPNITINNQPLLSPPNEDGSFVLDNDINVHLSWESRCFPGGGDDSLPNGDPENNNKGVDAKSQRSQSVTLTLQAVDGQPVKEELSCTIWFRQEEPVWAFGVAGWCVDARIRDVRGKTGGWEVVFDDENEKADTEASMMGTTEGKRESREERLKRERKEFEREVKCLEYQKSIATAEERDSTGVAGSGYAQKPVVMNRKYYEERRQHFETLCANLPPRANDTSTPGPSAHPPWELPHHRPAKPARLPFPDLLLDSSPGSAHQTTLNSRPSSLRASIYAHLINLSPIRLAAYIIFLSLLILACFFHSLHRVRSRRKRLAQGSGAGEPVGIESLCPGFYGSDESCGECKARYFAQLQARDESGTLIGTGEFEGEGDNDEMAEKRGSLEEKKEGMSELCMEEQEKQERQEKKRLSEREYQRYCEYHAVPEDGFALRYEPGSELQTVHEPVEQVVIDDERIWDEKETLVDSEDEREKERGDEVGESSGEDSGGEDSDDDLSIGGELASFMRAANLVEDMIRAGARREAAPRPQAALPVNARRQSPGTPPPPSYGEVVGLRGVVDDEGLLPPRYEEYLRSRR